MYKWTSKNASPAVVILIILIIKYYNDGHDNIVYAIMVIMSTLYYNILSYVFRNNNKTSKQT